MTDQQEEAEVTGTEPLMEFLQRQLHEATAAAFRNTACIATFSSSRFGDDVKDDALASELAQRHGTDSSNIEVKKKLFAAECPELGMLKQHVRATYTKHRKMTHTWKKRGGGLLPNAKIPEYLGVMGEASQRLDALRGACKLALPQAHARAKLKLGSAYREDDYTDLMGIPDKFQIHFELEPIPDSDDLVMPPGYETVQVRGLFEGVRARFARAMAQQWGALRGDLTVASDKCADNKEVKRWHQSMLSNPMGRIKELRSMADSLGCFASGPDCDTFSRALDTVESKLASHDVKRIAATEGERKRFAKDLKYCQGILDGASSVLGTEQATAWQPPPAQDTTEDEPGTGVQGSPEIVQQPQARSQRKAVPEPSDEGDSLEAILKGLGTSNEASDGVDNDEFGGGDAAAHCEEEPVEDAGPASEVERATESPKMDKADPVAALAPGASLEDILQALLHPK